MTDSPVCPGLYIHLPFCSAICPYCDFYVLTGSPNRRRRFHDHLLREIESCARAPWPTFVDPAPQACFDTLYLGGGTPSIQRPEDLQELRAALHENLNIVKEPWIGLEANPEDLTAENVAAWEDLGVDFLSLGIQSFDDRVLKYLGRAHTSNECHASVDLAKQGRFTTLSLDLIYGIPGQSVTDWQAELESALELELDHLSCYQLTIEPRTPFGFRHQRGQLSELSRKGQEDLFFFTHRFLEERGVSAYEVSNFATSAVHQSRHNAKYWNHQPYLGLGPSAHSFAFPHRWWNCRKIKPYEDRVQAGHRPVEESEILSATQMRLERLMLGLRTPDGVDFDVFPDGSGIDLWDQNQLLIDDLVSSKLMTRAGHKLAPTLAGLAVAEATACRFDLLEP